MLTINLTAPQPQGNETWVKCELGCIIHNTPDPFSYAKDLEKKLNEEGIMYGQVLDDANKFLCIDPINGAYIGNVSTDHQYLMKFLSRQHLDFFINEHASQLPSGIEYNLSNPFHGLNEEYVVIMTIVEPQIEETAIVDVPVVGEEPLINNINESE